MRRRLFLGSLAALGYAGLSHGAPAAREPLSINYGESFAPYNWRDDKGELRGILLDLLHEALVVRLGIPVRSEGFPWVRAQKLMREGYADAICTVPTAERLAFAKASKEPVATSNFTLFCRADSPLLNRLRQARTLADLREFHLVHYIGSSWAKLNLTGERISWANSQNVALAMVAARRGDAIVDSSIALRWTIRQLGLHRELVELPQVFSTESFNLLIRRTSPHVAMLPQFDRAMKKMRAEGAVKRVLDKYHAGRPLRAPN